MVSNNPHVTVLGSSGEFDDDDIIYVALDAILDTRLGTLGKIDPALAKAALDNGYRQRMVDSFEGISREAFKAAYAARDIDTLKMSVVSNVSFLLRRIIKDSLALAVQQEKVTRLNIDVNVWPYAFEPGPMTDMLISCIRVHTYENTVVRIISVNPDHLTPMHILATYQLLVMYDWLDWFSYHKEFFEKKGIPAVAFVVPALCLERAPTTEEMRELSPDGTDLFTITERLYAPMLRLNMMPASLFSMIDEIKKENAATKAARVQVTPEQLEDIIKQQDPQARVVHEPAKPAALDLAEVARQVDNDEDEHELL